MLAKFPQQRIRVGASHPSYKKLEKLFDYMDELQIDFCFERGRIIIVDHEFPKAGEWEVRDIVDGTFLARLPCSEKEYKLTQDVDIYPKQAQPAVKVENKDKVISSSDVPKQKKLSTKDKSLDHGTLRWRSGRF